MPTLDLTPLASPLITAIGWTLVHFCWQGIAIALSAWAAFTLTRSARARYAIGCAAMFLMLATPVGTFGYLQRTAPAAIAIATVARAPTLGSAKVAAARQVSDPLQRSFSLPPQPSEPQPTTAITAALPWLVVLWSAGVIGVALHHLLGFAAILRLRRSAVAMVDPAWLARMDRLRTALRIRRSVDLLATNAIDCPGVVGLLRPAILWPAAALTGLSPTQIEALLAHELAHIVRHDYLANLLQSAVETLLFYHPAVWWLSQRVRQEREHCCDDMAADVIGNRATYAAALAAMETHRGAGMSFPLALSSNGGSLVNRIRRLLSSPTSSDTRARRSLFGIVALALLAVGVSVAMVLRDRNSSATQANATPQASGMTQTTQPVDYRLQPNDVVQVTVFGLTGPASESRIIKRLTETGRITLPMLELLTIGNQTEAEAEKTISDAYQSAQIINSATISITTLDRSDGRVIRSMVVPGETRDIEAATPPVARRDDIAAASPAPATPTPLARYRDLLIQKTELLETIKNAEAAHAEPELRILRGLLRDLEASIANLTSPPGTYSLDAVGFPFKNQQKNLSDMRPTTLREGVADYLSNGVVGPVGASDKVRLSRRDPTSFTRRETIFTVDEVAQGEAGKTVLIPDDRITIESTQTP